MNARKQYLEEVGKEYRRADETGRGRLLDEAEKRTGLNRKYLIRVLNHPLRPRGRKRRRRRAEYGANCALMPCCWSGLARSSAGPAPIRSKVRATRT